MIYSVLGNLSHIYNVKESVLVAVLMKFILSSVPSFRYTLIYSAVTTVTRFAVEAPATAPTPPNSNPPATALENAPFPLTVLSFTTSS